MGKRERERERVKETGKRVKKEVPLIRQGRQKRPSRNPSCFLSMPKQVVALDTLVPEIFFLEQLSKAIFFLIYKLFNLLLVYFSLSSEWFAWG